MRITVDIEESVLDEVMQLTGEKGKSPAIAQAVTGFVRRARAREFGRLIREGAFDYSDGPAFQAGPGDDPLNPVPALDAPGN